MNTFAPIAVCESHRVSFHDTEDNRQHHASNHHSPEVPCAVRIATEEEHAAAGWNTSDYPRSISL